MGEQAGDGGAAGVIRTQDLPEKDPERDQRGEDPIQPAAQRGQRLGDHLFGEDVGERQLAVVEELAAEETHLGAKGTGVRMRHVGSLLAGKGRLATSILASEALFAYLIVPLGLVEIHVPFVAVSDHRR
jgi:hypothetical protein